MYSTKLQYMYNLLTNNCQKKIAEHEDEGFKLTLSPLKRFSYVVFETISLRILKEDTKNCRKITLHYSVHIIV